MKNDGGFSIKDNTSGMTYRAHVGQTLAFSDASVNLRAGDLAASIPAADLRRLILLYTAYFDRVPDADGLVYWIERFKAGMTVTDIAEKFPSAGVQYASATGYSDTMSNAEFVRHISRNVFGTAPAPETQPNWIIELDNKTLTRGQVVGVALNIGESYKGNPVTGYVADLLDKKFAAGFQLAVQQGLSFRTPEECIEKGMQISNAVAVSGTSAALALAAATQADFSLYTPAPRTAADPITLDTLRACPSSLYDKSPDFYRCLIGHAEGTTDSGSEPCKLTVYEDGRFAVTTLKGTHTVSPPYGSVSYSKLDLSGEKFFTMNASITGNSTEDLLFAMAFTSPALANVVGTVPGIRLTSGAFSCTLGV